MLREGPIPPAVHGALEYLVGLLLIAAPFLFGFESSLAIGISVATGVVVLGIAAATRGPTGLVNSIPVPVHVTLDFLLAAFFIAAPFVFGFSGEAAPRNLFLLLGVVHLLVSIGTRFRTEKGNSSRLA